MGTLKASTRALLLLFTAIFSSYVFGQEQQPAINWEKGPITADLGGIAQLKIPAGYMFTDKKGTQKLLELTENIPNGREVGAIIPENSEKGKTWFVIFEFDEVGFVKDDDKSNLDGDKLLKSIQDATEESNETRKEKGWPAFHISGWEHPPYYDQATNNLTWSIQGHDDQGGKSINHSIRILGRHGTMNVDVVLGPEQAAEVIPEFNSLMTSFQFRQGSRYADFVSGDKVASYGLTALIAGGAGAIAVKTGLLMKLWKLIVVVVLALKKALIVIFVGLWAAIKKLWNRIRGRKEEEQPTEYSPPPEEVPVVDQSLSSSGGTEPELKPQSE